jgi:hypothetical protein
MTFDRPSSSLRRRNNMKLSFTLFIFLISFLAYGQDHDCNEVHPELNDILNMSKHIPWEAASVSNIKAAHCMRKTPFTEDEMTKWMVANQSPATAAKKINGIAFEGESPENLKTFEYLTNAKNLFGDTDSKRQKSFTSTCKKVACAVKDIFGSTGTQLLFMHRKFGMNGSHLAKDSTSSWKKAELDSILLALTDYPEGILPIQENRPLVHFERGYMRGPGQENVIANASIEIFDLWNEQGAEEKRYTLTHELGHAIAGVTGLDDSKKWMKLSGWETITKVVKGKTVKTLKLTKPETIISKYGLTNNWEDLAESASAYRYNPKQLKKVSPEKYAFIKEVLFDNVEYTSEEACKNPKRLSQSLKEKGQLAMNSLKATPQDLKSISDKCSSLAIKKLSLKGTVNLADIEIQTCYEKEIGELGKAKALASMNNLPNKEFLAPLLRNIKFKPISPDKLKSIVVQARDTHRNTLKTELIKGFNSNYSFGPGSKINDFTYSYQSFGKGIGFDSFSMKSEFATITNKASEQIKKNGSLRRWINLDYSDTEITDQVNAMIN